MMLDEKALDELAQKHEKAPNREVMSYLIGGASLDYYGATHEAFPSLIALASFGLKAKAFLGEHGTWARSKLYQSPGVQAEIDALLDSARALTEAKGGK